jgi:uncharacterized protein
MSAALVALVFVANVVSVAEVPSPRPAGWVTDQANVLDADAEAKLNAIGNELNARRGIEIAVVTVDDVAGTPKQFATELFNTWKIGNAQTNNGVLVLLVMGKRRLEVETGTGIEAALTAAWLSDMQGREMVPKFKAGQFGAGMVAGVQAIADHLRDAPAESDSTAPAGTYRSNGETTSSAAPEPARVAAPKEANPIVGFGLGVLGAAGIGGAGLLARHVRRRRYCRSCNPPRKMLALGEVEDDAHLDTGQRAEERIGSVDYEVLICAGCQASRTLRHGKWFSGYSRCSKCSYKTLKSTSITTVHATYDHGGQVQVDERCANCSYRNSYTTYTSALTRPSESSSSSSSYSSSSSSSSSYSSSSSSSGYSGGSSSGGGAGSSW